MTSFLGVLKGETQLIDACIGNTFNNNCFMNNFSNFLSAKTILFIYGENELYKYKVIKTIVTRKVTRYG